MTLEHTEWIEMRSALPLLPTPPPVLLTWLFFTFTVDLLSERLAAVEHKLTSQNVWGVY